MQEGRPSRTAFSVARRRAAHQILDHRPLVLDDPVAVRILGPDAEAGIAAESERHAHPFGRAMRAFMVARSRYAEDQLRVAVANGVQQYVVLGAGLDTFAYRNPYAPGSVHVFEVDYPATQHWKQQLLAEAGIEIPPSLTFVPVDFERQTLTAGLADSGFNLSKAAFCSWLGVTPYLTLEAFRATVRAIAALPSGSGVTFEYALSRSSLGLRERLASDFIAARVKAAGEPFQLSFSPEQLKEELMTAGFHILEEMTSDEINTRYFNDRRDGLRLHGGGARLITAWV